jgi:hypothetical protein
LDKISFWHKNEHFDMTIPKGKSQEPTTVTLMLLSIQW